MGWVKAVDVAIPARDCDTVLRHENELGVGNVVLATTREMQSERPEATSEAPLNGLNVHGYCLHLSWHGVKLVFAAAPDSASRVVPRFKGPAVRAGVALTTAEMRVLSRPPFRTL